MALRIGVCTVCVIECFNCRSQKQTFYGIGMLFVKRTNIAKKSQFFKCDNHKLFFKSQFISQITILFLKSQFSIRPWPTCPWKPDTQLRWCDVPISSHCTLINGFIIVLFLYSASIVQLFDPPQVSQTCPNWRLLPSFPSPSLSCSNHSYRLYSIELPSHPTATSLVSPPSLPPPSQIIMRHYTRPPTDYNALQ